MKKKKKRPPKREAGPRDTRPAAAPTGPPEILAPAGSPASWAAAVEAGADAVYMGMKSFSARAFAANFTLHEFARIIEMSRERGVKVFVAFNALLKEPDLPEAAKGLENLTKLGPDALILQDPGLLRLVKKYWPHFEVHASTLTGVHNRPGLDMLADMGFDRAVVARELTLDEIERLAAGGRLGLEMFIHGALCFSVSGLCLMSSFLGGKGSLRGACTQPCRRLYESGRKRGYFFSPMDLSAVEHMGRIRRMPLSALKIEGRMKGPAYVGRVVKAYRLLMDADEEDLPRAVQEADDLLSGSMGRVRSTGFLASRGGEGALAPQLAAASGQFLGKVVRGREDGGLLVLEKAAAQGDRLRVQFKKDDERKALTLKRMRRRGEPATEAAAGDEVFLETPFGLSDGDLVFKVDAAGEEKEALASPLIEALGRPAETEPALAEEKASPRLKKALKEIKPPPGGGGGAGRPDVWYKIPRSEMAPQLMQYKPGRVILPATRANIRRMTHLRRRLADDFDKIVWALPPLIFNPGALRTDLSQLTKMGVRQYMIPNIGALPLLTPPQRGKKALRVFGDHRLNCLNHQAEKQLAALGLAGWTLSLESDEASLAAVLNQPPPGERLLYLFGRPPLFTSRFKTGLKDNLPVISPKKERFRLHQERETLLAVAEQPVFFAPFLKYKNLNGVAAFIVDLEFDPRPLATAKEVAEALSRGRPLRNASRFNLKRGLY